jgi:trehalose synthase
MHEVHIEPKAVESFAELLGRTTLDELHGVADALKRRLGDRVIWNVNSTAAGGGVAEMLHTLLAYARGMGVDTRWLVVEGNPEFFAVTKRIHNALHGEVGNGITLDRSAALVYDQVTAENLTGINERIRPGDVAILHDPQTAGLIPSLVRRGVGVIWRCHIGTDTPSVESDMAWTFLEPYLTRAHAFIFSRFAYLPNFLYHGRCLILPPAIDPFSAKNQEMTPQTVHDVLGHIGLIQGVNGNGSRLFLRRNGQRALVERRADVVREGAIPTPDVPLVVQVSRWDRLKDPVGVLRGFARSMVLPGANGAHLMLAGPDVNAVADDPEGAEVFEEVQAEWRKLPVEHRRRVHLVNLPMDDLEENAAMVNACGRDSG